MTICVVCIRVGYFYRSPYVTWSLTHYAIMYSYTHEYILIIIIMYMYMNCFDLKIHVAHNQRVCFHIRHATMCVFCCCSPPTFSPVQGATGGAGAAPVTTHMSHQHHGEAMDTTSPSSSSSNHHHVPRSPAIATKNSDHKQRASPGTQNRPPHLQMNL